MNTDNVVYNLGQVVYSVVSPETVGVVTGILFRPDGISYQVTWGDFEERSHYDCELTPEANYRKKK